MIHNIESLQNVDLETILCKSVSKNIYILTALQYIAYSFKINWVLTAI